jgi:hypothetical protein
MISRRVLLTLVVLAALIAAARLHTYHEPLERDVTGAAVIGHELLLGRALYADMWDHKPPALHVTHAVAITLAGYGPGAIYLLNIVAALTTLLGVYAAASAAGGVAAGLWGAAFWTFVCGDLWLQANQPNTEAFINACLVWAFALLVRAGSRPATARLLAVGALFALGSLYKPIVVAPAAMLALAHLAAPPTGESRRRALVDVCLLAAVGAVAWLGTFAYFAAVGRFSDFYQAVFVYNRFYSGSVLRNLVAAAAPDALVPGILAIAAPLALLTLAGGIRAAIVGPGRPWLYLAALVVGTELAIALPGQFYPHYYQLWLPPLSVGAGWALAAFARMTRIPRWAPHAVGAAVLLLLLSQQLPLYQVPAETWARLKYGELFVSEDHLGRELGALLAPGETFYEWGAETGLYFRSHRSPPSGAFYVFPLLAGPAAGPLAVRAVADLERRPPTMFVVNKGVMFGGRIRHPILNWAEPRYVAMAGSGDRGTFTLFVRRGSRLDVTRTP